MFIHKRHFLIRNRPIAIQHKYFQPLPIRPFKAFRRETPSKQNVLRSGEHSSDYKTVMVS